MFRRCVGKRLEFVIMLAQVTLAHQQTVLGDADIRVKSGILAFMHLKDAALLVGYEKIVELNALFKSLNNLHFQTDAVNSGLDGFSGGQMRV